MSNSPLGTRKNPTRLRLGIIFVLVFVGSVLFLSLSSGKANAAPPVLAEVDKGGAYTLREDNTTEKYLATIAVGTAGGYAAGGPPGAYFGFVGSGLGVLIDWHYSD